MKKKPTGIVCPVCGSKYFIDVTTVRSTNTYEFFCVPNWHKFIVKALEEI